MTFNNVIQLLNLEDKVHFKGGAVDTWENYKVELAFQLKMEIRVVAK